MRTKTFVRVIAAHTPHNWESSAITEASDVEMHAAISQMPEAQSLDGNWREVNCEHIYWIDQLARSPESVIPWAEPHGSC